MNAVKGENGRERKKERERERERERANTSEIARVIQKQREGEGERRRESAGHVPRARAWVGESKLMECHFASYVPSSFFGRRGGSTKESDYLLLSEMNRIKPRIIGSSSRTS